LSKTIFLMAGFFMLLNFIQDFNSMHFLFLVIDLKNIN
jgi:hypothetical protein